MDLSAKAGNQLKNSQLPITRLITPAYALSLVIALLVAGASLAGLFFQSSFYPTDELRKAFVANDVVNLLLGLPVLLVALWLTWRGKLVGLLLWPGALLYILYNSIAYLFGVPFSGISLLYLALVLLSACTIFVLLRSIDRKSVQRQLTGAVPVRTAGWVLVVFGVLFFFRAIGMIAQAFTNRTTLLDTETGVLTADLVISTLWTAGGLLLLRRKPLGYASGLGLLFAVNMLFLGLILFLLLQPLFTAAPFVLVDVIVVLIMGMICFIPFVLFLRGTLSTETRSG